MIRNTALAALLVFTLALVAPAASPLQLSYVASESMEPTISTNDGYLLVPAASVEAGDIITFYSEQRDSYVTHRAIRVTDDGIVTRGDANPSTDQASGHPLVQESEVSGRVLTVGGDPVVLPHLGTLLSLLRTYWYLVGALLLGYLLLGGLSDARRRSRDSVLRSRDVVVPVTILAVVAGVALVSTASVHQTQQYTVTDQSTTDPDVLTVGEPRTESITVQLATTPLTHVVTETDGMQIVNTTTIPPNDSSDAATAGGERLLDRVFESSSQNLTVTVPGQGQPGTHTTSLDMYPYPATLPAGVIETLHGVHPLVATVGTVLVVLVPVYLGYWLVVDTTAPLRGSRQRLTRRLGGRR